MRENLMRGTSPMAVGARRAACVHGHLFDEANTIVNGHGHRKCRTCKAEWERRWKRAHRPEIAAYFRNYRKRKQEVVV